ncbi:hypothetical protein MMC14_006329 [Varicellaria rhodocarpa]|nr:hypothetical protein [Varicellaria rhodocarpa]
MSSNNSGFWSEAAGICTIIGLIFGTCLSAVTLYLTWRQYKLSERHDAADDKRLDKNAVPFPQLKWMSFNSSSIALIVAALIFFGGTVALAASVPRIQALNSSKPQATALPSNTSISDSPASTVSTPVSASPTSAPINFPTSYHTIGCYKDSNDTRILNATSTSADSMTVPGCAEFCEEYAYFGTEYCRNG